MDRAGFLRSALLEFAADDPPRIEPNLLYVHLSEVAFATAFGSASHGLAVERARPRARPDPRLPDARAEPCRVTVSAVLHREDEEGLIIIGQPAHAWVSGQLARAWGNDRFGRFAPSEEVCLAAEQHDVGMAASDAQPALNAATGLPYSFREIPLRVHIALWTSTASIVLPQSRYAALLVSLHGTGLYEGHDPTNASPQDNQAVRDYVQRENAFQEELLDSLRADSRYAPYAAADVVARNRRLVARFDGISLALCHALRFEHAHEGIPTADGETTITATPVDGDPREYVIDPWPFRNETVTLVYEGRRLSGRFAEEETMRAALRRAPWQTLMTLLRPA
jgi:hypothetical protein